MYYFSNDQRLTIIEMETIFVLLYLYHLDNLKALPTAQSFLKFYFSKYRDLLWRIEHLLAVILPLIYFFFCFKCVSTWYVSKYHVNAVPAEARKGIRSPKWSYRHL